MRHKQGEMEKERERERETEENQRGKWNVKKREGRWKVLNRGPSNDLAPLQA